MYNGGFISEVVVEGIENGVVVTFDAGKGSRKKTYILSFFMYKNFKQENSDNYKHAFFPSQQKLTFS